MLRGTAVQHQPNVSSESLLWFGVCSLHIKYTRIMNSIRIKILNHNNNNILV